MSTAESPAESIYFAALAKESPQDRAAYLDEACGADAELRRRVERLLQAQPKVGSFLEAAVDAPQATVAQSDRFETAGTIIGSYKLLEQIGEGGMGTVWMAQQTEPVKRVVALKVIKAGMDSKHFIARFEAERQALALMDHANIARVLDAGTTSAGRPYFVMDLVKGVPITKYCDEHHLTPRQRLELFIPVCQAVQHAHQKGIIHRDLKPSNVLVALYDGKPVPKVIDFGVAKAAGHSLTDKTLVTGFGNIVGTLEYMSPEQAEVNQLDIDTRSDIYSLGVLLYELLTGGPPFTRKELEKAGMLEMLRVIREQEPSKPSTKLSTAEGLPTLAANRGTEPAKLTKLVRGELDWIVMKALEKDRNRRYETANSFATDLMRYLADEPVQACPASTRYRLRKFARRNKGPVLAASLVVTVIVAGIIGTTWGMFRATQAEADAKREAGEKTVALSEKETALATAKANETRAKAAQKDAQENLKDAVGAVDQMLTRVGNDRLSSVPQMETVCRDLLQDAVNFYKRFLEKNGDDPTIRKETALAYRRLADMYRVLGLLAESELAHRNAFALFEKLEAQAPLELSTRDGLVGAHIEFAVTLRALGRREEAEQHIRQAARIAEQLLREAPEDHYGDTLANANLYLAEYLAPDEKEKLLRRNLTLAKGPVFLGLTQRELSGMFAATGRHSDAEEAASQAVKLMEQVLAQAPSANWTQAYLGYALSELADRVATNGRTEAAVEICGRAITVLDKVATDFPAIHEYRIAQAYAHQRHADILKKLNRTADAEKSYRRAVDLFEKLAADFPTIPGSWQTAFDSRLGLGQFLKEAGKIDEAARLYQEAGSIASKLPTDDRGRFAHWTALAGTQVELGQLLAAAGKQPEAQAAFGEAVAIRDRLEKQFADKAEFRCDLAASHHAIGHALKAAGHRDEAIKSLRMALSHWEKQAAEFPRDTGYRHELAKAHVQLAYLLPRPQAEQEFRTAVGIHENLVAETSGENAVYLGYLGHNRRWLAYNLWATGNTKEAEKLFGEAMIDFEKLSAAHPDVSTNWHFQADSQHLVGQLLAIRMQFDEAEKAYRRAIEIHEQRMARFPDQPITRTGEEPLRLREVASAYSGLAGLLAATGRAQEGQTFHKKAIAVYRKVIDLQPDSPDSHNEIAWILATHPEASLRDPKRALELAKKAVELMPGAGNFWNTLGAAHYRADDWKAAVAALEKSMELRKGGDSNDWFFLAMAHWRLGEKDKAREFYDRAVQWMENNRPNNEELRRFRAEAAELLELTEKK